MTHHSGSHRSSGRCTHHSGAPHKKGVQHFKDGHSRDKGDSHHTHHSAWSKEREATHYQGKERSSNSKRPPLHPCHRERDQGKYKVGDRSRSIVFDRLGKNRSQKDSRDVLTDKQKTQGGDRVLRPLIYEMINQEKTPDQEGRIKSPQQSPQ